MAPHRRHWPVLGALLLALGSAQAQTPNPAPSARPDPLNAQAAVPALVHSPSLANYKRHAEAEPIGWREANDTVARIGGWRAYARESAASAPAAPTPAGAAPQAPTSPAGRGAPAVRKP